MNLYYMQMNLRIPHLLQQLSFIKFGGLEFFYKFETVSRNNTNIVIICCFNFIS